MSDSRLKTILVVSMRLHGEYKGAFDTNSWGCADANKHSNNNVNTVEYRSVVVTTDVKTPLKVRILCFPQFYMSSVVF